MEPDILYEDNHLLVVNKPAGLLIQGDSSGAPSLLDVVKAFIKKRDDKPGNVFIGMVHRLDRPVSGVVVLAKTSKAAGRLSAQIRNRTVKKLYVGLTCHNGRVGQSTGIWRKYRHFLIRPKDRTMVTHHLAPDSREGVLQLKTVLTTAHHACHLIRLMTGRKHQIRAQLAHLDMPLCGDTHYGSKELFLQDAIALHAVSFELLHPVKKHPLRITAPLPPWFAGYFPAKQVASLEAKLQKDNGNAGNC
ncbi:MAG: RluA family pseudouridine synthase [Desulfopila sp.]